MTQHEQNDPIAVFNRYEKALNAGDSDAVMALFDDHVTTSEVVTQMFPAERTIDSLRQYLMQTVIHNHGELRTIRIARVDDWLYAVHEMRSDLMKRLGLQRIRGIDELEVRNNRITHFCVIADPSDPQTRQFIQGQFSGEVQRLTSVADSKE